MYYTVRMATVKLTLSLDRKTIAAAKNYGTQHKISLSKLIGRYFKSLSNSEETLSPIVGRLLGILPAKIDVKDHKKYLSKKYAFKS